jgi:hypothetical protein
MLAWPGVGELTTLWLLQFERGLERVIHLLHKSRRHYANLTHVALQLCVEILALDRRILDETGLASVRGGDVDEDLNERR